MVKDFTAKIAKKVTENVQKRFEKKRRVEELDRKSKVKTKVAKDFPCRLKQVLGEIRKAAAKGRNSLELPVSLRGDENQLLASKISSELCKRGFRVESGRVSRSDDFSEDALFAYW